MRRATFAAAAVLTASCGSSSVAAPPATSPGVYRVERTLPDRAPVPSTVVARPARASRGRTTRQTPNLAGLRACESGGDYANRRNGTFRGGYQFDRATWASVGGAGDPADASPAEQDARALALYQRRGAAPWPYCGRFL